MTLNVRTIGLAAPVLAVLALGGCVNRAAQAQAEETKKIVTDQTVPVRVASVTSQDVPVELSLTGSLVADDDVYVSAKNPGRLTVVYVREGDSVRAGQVLARQESVDASARLRQAQAQVSAARAQWEQAKTDARVSPTKSAAAVQASESRLRQAQANLQKLLNGARVEERRQSKANLDAAKSNLDTAGKSRDRAQRLFDQGAIAKADLEAAQNQYQSALASYTAALESYNLVLDSVRPEDIAAAREQVRQAEQQLTADRANQRLDPVLQQRVDAAQANLNAAEEAVVLARQAVNDLAIVAPASGKVSGKPLKAGSYAAPGAPILRLVGLQGVYYEADVPESDISQLKVGLPVQVTVDAVGGTVLSGSIGSVDPLASELGRLYRVRVLIRENLQSLKAGMFARGNVRLRTDEGALVIPSNAIIRDGETTTVYIVEGGKAARKEVKVTLTRGSFSVIEGLRLGDQVITEGKSAVVPGSEVRVEDGSPPEPSQGSGTNEQEN